MTTWPDLVAAALVGTDRRPLPDAVTPVAPGLGDRPPSGPGAVASSLRSEDTASAVLDRAAAWSVYRRAGAVPVRELAAPRPAPADPVPVVGPAAAARLAGLVDQVWDGDSRPALIVEWLTVAADRGRRVPPEMLPDLLEAGRRNVALRPLIVAVSGGRGGWLAAQNPEWTYLTSTADHTAPDAPAAWQEGTRGERIGHLTARRRGDPDGARELLAADWATLPPDERAELLAALATGLGPADEEFLEAALDDRRKEVRATAAELLAALPGSAYNRRMVERAAAGLRPGPDGGLLVEPPVACDAAMRRDGIVSRPPAGTGERAWWLEQILARAPLAGEPAELLARPVSEGWKPTVHRGLARAAAARGDGAWAAALLDAFEPGAKDGALVEQLYAALDPDELARRCLTALEGAVDPEAWRAAEWKLGYLPAPWSRAVSIAALQGYVLAARRGLLPGRTFTWLAALRMPPELADEANRLAEFLLSAGSDSGGQALARLAATLRLRREMIRELT